MASLNKVFILGNLTSDPQLRSTNSGSPVCEFRIATNHRYKKKNEWFEDVAYIDVTVWGKLGENSGENLTKGSLVLVEGRLRYQTWIGPDGDKRSKHDIVASHIQFLDKKNRNIRSRDSLEKTSDQYERPGDSNYLGYEEE